MASGDTLLVLKPFGAEPPPSGAAAIRNRNGHPTLNFDDTANEKIRWSCVMPRHYGGGGVTAYVHYAMSSATSGNVEWRADWERIGDGQQDIDADGFTGSPQSTGPVAVPATCGHVDVAPITFTDGPQIDGVQTGEGFRLELERNTGVTNNAAGDAELLFLELKET